MKSLYIFILFSLVCFTANAQMHMSTSVYNGDTTISTDFQTLYGADSGHTTKPADNVVGVRTISGKKSTYWLFFYFYPSDIPAAAVTISGHHYAYFKTAEDKYYRIPYSGKAYTYSTKAKAGFFIDITRYVQQLKDELITHVRLQTSVLYHEVELKETSQFVIADVVTALLSR